MSKLKTLKDLDFISCTKYFAGSSWECLDKTVQKAIKKELKQEAIRWIKMLREKRKELTNRFEIGWNEGRQDFIEDFFGITEEDLK